MLQPHDRVVVAVSGGPDSVSLLHIMLALAEKFNITIYMAYLNHGLRGEESIKEQSFVKQLSEKLAVPITCKTIDILDTKRRQGGGMSIEELGRQERYQFLIEAAEKCDAQKIALGHHFNDQCETVMINLIRGSGVDGLKGILPVRDGKIIRPLINCTKKEILAYLDDVGLPFVRDLSNAEDIYLRNRIRHHLIPEITNNYNAGFERNLHQMADIMRVDNDYLLFSTNKALTEMRLDRFSRDYRIKISQFLSYHEAIQNRVIKVILQSFSPSPGGVAYVHVKVFKDMILGDNLQASLNLPFGIEVKRNDDIISIRYRPRKTNNHERRNGEDKNVYFQYDNVPVPGNVDIAEHGLTIHFSVIEGINSDIYHLNVGKSAYMDYHHIAFPLTVRSLKPGDRIRPLGMKGTQKLKSLFINEKVPDHLRHKIPLLADAESVIWVAGMRLSERVKITNKTRKILKVEIV